MGGVYIGLGSNLGDRAGWLRAGVAGLAARGVPTLRRSTVVETPPWGLEEQPPFLNAVIEVAPGTHTPETLLALLRTVEDACGRTRTLRWGPRTLDLDLLVFGRERRTTRTLELPHPRLHQRAFVLAPLAELDAGLIVGPNGESVGACLAAVGRAEIWPVPGAWEPVEGEPGLGE